MNRQTTRMVIIVVCIALLSMGGWQALTPLSSQGYITGYQGAKAQFYGIEYSYDLTTGAVLGQGGTTEHKQGKTTFNLKGTSFNFDPDDPSKHQCNLDGAMTAVFIPKGSISTWVPRKWWSDAVDNIVNPVNAEPYLWNIEEQKTNKKTGEITTTTYAYSMDEYKCKWYVTISAEWDGVKFSNDGEMNNRRYSNTRVWFEFDIQPIWYFEGAETCYFCIAELRVSDLAVGGKLQGEARQDASDIASEKCRVNPPEYSVCSIYYEAYGLEDTRAEVTKYDFQGRKLNPDLFRDRVYSYISLVDFGTKAWRNAFTFWQTKYKGDVVTFGFDVHVFVVGEWVVKDVQEIPDEYGKLSKTGGAPSILDPFKRLAEMFQNPEFRTWIIIGIIAFIVLMLAIFMPNLLFSVFAFRKKGGRKTSKPSSKPSMKWMGGG